MDYSVKIGIEKIDLNEIQKVYENKLEPVFACNIKTPEKAVNAYSFTAKTRISPKIGIKKPKVLIPVFPGTTTARSSCCPAASPAATSRTAAVNL